MSSTLPKYLIDLVFLITVSLAVYFIASRRIRRFNEEKFHEKNKIESQLLQLQKMEMVSTLAGGIAHDLNNQLTPLMGYIDMSLSQTEISHPNHKLLTEASQSAKRCAEVVQRLINFSKPASQHQTSVGVNLLLDEMKTLFPKFMPATVEAAVSYETGLWVVSGNDAELQTVLMNLALNARDAMPDQTGQVSFEASNSLLGGKSIKPGFEAGPYVHILVRDNGSGIAPETLTRIFEPFFTTKKKGESAGLGLAMVFNIVKNHHGWIEVQSKVGEGATFHIYLPADPQAKLKSHDEVKPIQIAKANGRESILFADDEEHIRTLGRIFLERLGYTAVMAADGEEAVKIYREHQNKISAVVLDMTMPKLSGRQTLKKILEINPQAQVILASGYTSEGTAEELIKEGAKIFLQKPYTVQPLGEALRTVLNKS